MARRDDRRDFSDHRNPGGVFGLGLVGAPQSWRTLGDTLYLIGPERPRQRGHPGDRVHETWYLDMYDQCRSKFMPFDKLATFPSFLRDPGQHDGARELMHARALLDERAANAWPEYMTGNRRREAREHAERFAQVRVAKPGGGNP